MAILTKSDRLRSSFQTARDSFRMPDPIDNFIVIAFGWASVCFLLVVGGDQIARRAALLSGSRALRQIILSDQSAIAFLMIGGVAGLAAAFYVLSRLKFNMVIALFFAMTFANATWAPLYSLSFAVKYLVLIYLAGFTFLFFLKNGWRLASSDGYRWICAYLAWIAVIAVANGLNVQDVWYLATEFILMIGVGAAWFSQLNDRESIERFNRMLAYVAVLVTLFHLLAPALAPVFIVLGRFVGMSGRATGFATIYAIFVVALFWLSMYEKSLVRSRVFTAIAFVGFGMILWSGTRNATVATLIGITALWWVIRSRILVYILLVGIFGLVIQLILGANDDVSMLSERLQSTENTRLDIWKLYLGLTAKSPFFGYAYSGLAKAVYGETFVGLLSSFARINPPGVHNLYLGFAVRWGLPGLFLHMLLFVLPALTAWRVIFNNRVPMEEKRVYILPVALLLVVALEGLFEDTMGSTGKGTVHNLVYALGIPVVYLYGNKLLSVAQERPRERRQRRVRRNIGGAIADAG